MKLTSFALVFTLCFGASFAIAASHGKSSSQYSSEFNPQFSSEFIKMIKPSDNESPKEKPPKDACLKNCTADSDCGPNASCNNNVCKRKSQFCSNERWSTNDRGESINCGPYSCNSKTGACRRFAQQTTDCSFGFVFDGKSNCIPSVECADGDLSCSEQFERWQKSRQNWEAQYPEPKIEQLSCQTCKENMDCNNSEIGSEIMCWKNLCVREDLYCTTDGQHYFSNNKYGPIRTCGEYKCNQMSGECFNDCASNDDCNNGFKCNANRNCIKK
jgi:hypothetical protein